MIHCKNFTEDSFNSFPVWTWDDENEGHIPVEIFNPLPEDPDTYFIKASFELPSGRKFSGYLIGCNNFYAFGLFVNGKEFILNLNLPDRVESTLNLLFHTLNEKQIDFFPLKYETTFPFNSKSNLSGLLTF